MLHVWGCGQFGQHGHNHTQNISPENGALRLKENEKVAGISCGASHTIASTVDNKLYSWGNNRNKQLGFKDRHRAFFEPQCIPVDLQNAKIVGISCGCTHTAVWMDNGKCLFFGNGPINEESASDNRRVQEFVHTPSFWNNVTVKDVACGARHTVFCLTNGNVLTFGANNRGQLGNGTKLGSEEPVKVQGMQSIATHVACGNSHSLCLTDENDVYVWGYGPASGSDVDLSTAVAVDFDQQTGTLKKLQGGDSHSVALSENGEMFIWGSNKEGQFGEKKSIETTSTPLLLTSLARKGTCVDIAARDNTTAAVLDTGRVYIWGKNLWGIVCGDKATSKCAEMCFEVEVPGFVAEKVSLGSWHVALIGRNSQTKNEEVDNAEGFEIEEGRPEEITAESECEKTNQRHRLLDVIEASSTGLKEEIAGKHGQFVDLNNNELEKVDGLDAESELKPQKIVLSHDSGTIKVSKGNVAKSKRRSTFQRSKTFSVGEETLTWNRRGISENNIASNSSSKQNGEMQSKQRTSKKPGDNAEGSYIGLTKGGNIQTNKRPSASPFITQPSLFGALSRTQSSLTSKAIPTWNTEMLLQRSSSFPSFSLTSGLNSEKAPTASHNVQTRILGRSVNSPIQVQGAEKLVLQQLPKLMDRLRFQQSHFSNWYHREGENYQQKKRFSVERYGSAPVNIRGKR